MQKNPQKLEVVKKKFRGYENLQHQRQKYVNNKTAMKTKIKVS